jgi:Ca-activated chloride channel family protein
MKARKKILILLIVPLLIMIADPISAQQETNEDKTLSPYFFVKTDAPCLDKLPLKSTSVNINVSGVIADVLVTQVYKNEGEVPLEAIYVFPASTRAAVYGMKMTIGERTIIARIKKREDARMEYEEAKKAGQSASLLEQHRPNVFQMNVANILPSDTITIELRYTELLIPTDKVYEFVYPTVVGPRYSSQNAEDTPPSENWIQNPYLRQGESPANTFDLTLKLNAGMPIQDVTCTSHKVNIDYTGSNIAAIKLDSSEKYGCNRDFIVKYRLSGGKIESGLLLYEGKKENYFLIMMQPPKRIKVSQIPPREYMFIVDVSGSMHGFPLEISKKLLKDLIGSLRPKDRFNVLLFAGSSTVMSDKSLPATQENIRRAIDVIDRQRGGGGTRLLPALKKALSMSGTEGYSRNIVIATDGYVSVEKEAFDLIRNRLGEANMFTFGIGSSVNRHIIEGMARVGMGEPFVITRPEEAPSKAEKFRQLVQTPVLTDIRIDFGDFDAFDVEPPSIPDVLADRPVIVFGKYHGRPGTIELQGITGDGPFKKKIDVASIRPQKSNSALRYLWARHRISVLSDYNRLSPSDERVKEVTRIGLSHNLLTAYTSFIAVDSQKRLFDGQATIVKQPLPLPQGVSDYAVGKSSFAARTKACQALPAPSTGFPNGPETLSVKEESLECKKNHDAAESEISNSPGRQALVKLGKITIFDGLSEPVVRKLIEKQIHAINRCYAKADQSGSGPSKKAEVILTVDTKGHVTKVHIDSTKIKGSTLENCIKEHLEKLSFPPSKGGGIVKVTLTFWNHLEGN